MAYGIQADGNNIIYHNGWWHGNNNVLREKPADNTTIIVLGNRLIRAIMLRIQYGNTEA